jgi:hypothetical protein
MVWGAVEVEVGLFASFSLTHLLLKLSVGSYGIQRTVLAAVAFEKWLRAADAFDGFGARPSGSIENDFNSNHWLIIGNHSKLRLELQALAL